MAPTESPIKEEWAAMANKYGYRINANKILEDKLVEFIQIIIYLYKI